MFTFTKLFLALAATTLLCASTVASTSTYNLVADYSGPSFFDGFTTFTGPDPTHGNVNYIDMKTAAAQNLIGYVFDQASNSSRAYIGVDYTNVAANRDSVRLTSKQTFEVGMLAVFDIYHIPTALGTWPALWFLGDVSPDGVWPGNGGEIDAIEFVHGTAYNSMTLHTAPGCQVDNTSTTFQGTLGNTNCNAGSGDTGCSIAAIGQDKSLANNDQQVLATAGQAFNDQGGAVYAMSWTTAGVSVYMFSRDQLPSDLTTGTPEPSSWTNVKPLAEFSGSSCDFTKSLATMQLIEDITFCGDWAGKVWSSMGLDKKTGSATCADYVQNNPKSFRDAYFEVGSIKIYSSGTAPGTASSAKRDLDAVLEGVEYPTINVRDRYESETEAVQSVRRTSHQHHGRSHRIRHAGIQHRRASVTQKGSLLPTSLASSSSSATFEATGGDLQKENVLLLLPRNAAADNGALSSVSIWMVAAGVTALFAALL